MHSFDNSQSTYYMLDLRQGNKNTASALEKFIFSGNIESLNSNCDFGIGPTWILDFESIGSVSLGKL